MTAHVPHLSWFQTHFVTLFGLAVSLIALIWLGRNVAWADVGAALGSVQLAQLLPVPALLAVAFVLRALRWQVLIEHTPPVPFAPSFRALMMGYLFNTVLPARAGDLIRTLELARTQSIARTKVLATLVTEKIVDLGSVLIMLSMVLLVYPELPDWLGATGLAIGTLTSILLGVTLALHLLGPDRLAKVLVFLGKRLPDLIAARLEPMMRAGLQGLTSLFNPLRLGPVALLTGLTWAVEVILVHQVAEACGVDLSLGNALFLLLVLAVVSMVPASPGMIGTYEVFGVMALGILGIADGIAFVVVVTLHMLTLAGAILLGLVCMATRPATAPVFPPSDPANE